MPLNEPGGAFNFASLSPENIERIEVLRGAHSALFGSDAMASVIQLFSVRPDTRTAAAEPHAGRRQLRHGASRRRHSARERGSLEYSVFGSCLHTDNREPNNENKTSTRVGQRDALADARAHRCGFSAAASSDAPALPARRRSAGPTWMRFSGIATAAFSADGISRSARESRSRPAIRTSSRSTARRT